jgi:hypothetical protein
MNGEKDHTISKIPGMPYYRFVIPTNLLQQWRIKNKKKV